MKLIFTFKMYRILSKLQMRKKMFAVFGKMAFQHVVGIYLNYGENRCDRQSTC